MSRYTKALVREVTGEADATHSPVGWAGFQRRNDTLLWGQSQNFLQVADPGGAETITIGSNQVTKVFYERPTTWTIWIIIDIVRPPGETASLVVSYPIQIGVGTTFVTLRRSHSFPSPGPGGPEQFVDTLTVPAQGIQVDVSSVIGQSGVISAGPHSGRLTALAAPIVQ
jgi:hypothetical protein